MLAFLSVIDNESTRDQLEEIFHLYANDLVYIANDILNDPYEAEDVLQSALIQFAGYLDDGIDVKSRKTRGLIAIIVRNLSLNIYRQRKQIQTIDIDEVKDFIKNEDPDDPELNVLLLDRSKWIAQQLAAIKKEYADILAMKYLYGYSNTEIAGMCRISEENVRTRLTRAKQALQKITGEEHYD
jgi:RNA polymerase sigma-70 factor, ECF subfamily